MTTRMAIILKSGGQIDVDKYLRTTEDSIMDTHDDTSIEEQREIIRHSLHEIVNDIGMAMRDAGLHFPSS